MFPSSPTLASKWTELCGYGEKMLPPPHSRVCSEHFSPLSYQRDLQHELLGLPLRKKLKRDALPDQNLPQTPLAGGKVKKKTAKSKQNRGQDVSRLTTKKNKGLQVAGLRKKPVREDDGKAKQRSVPSLVKVEMKVLQPQNVVDLKNRLTKVKTINSSNNIKRIIVADILKPPPNSKSPKNESEINSIKKAASSNSQQKLETEALLPKWTNSRKYNSENESSINVLLSSKKSTFEKNDAEKFAIPRSPHKLKAAEENRKQNLPMRSSIRIAKKKSLVEIKNDYVGPLMKGEDPMVAKIRFLEGLMLGSSRSEVGRPFLEPEMLVVVGNRTVPG